MRTQRGFTLIEIAIVIVIAAFMIALFASVGTSLVSQQRRLTTVNKLAAVDAALVQYVMQQKRLPCPADGTATAGTEVGWAAGGCTGNQQNGVVPWVTLGLPEQDTIDGWGHRITYRLDGLLAGTGRMDMTWCDPSGSNPTLYTGTSACNPGCTNSQSTTLSGSCNTPTQYLAGKGLAVQNVAGSALTSSSSPNTQAAYVLISHGETGGGAYTNAGVLTTSTVTDGTQEQKNYASMAYVAAGGTCSAGATTTCYWVDDQISDISGTSHFDDLLIRPSIMSVVTRANLGPRPH